MMTIEQVRYWHTSRGISHVVQSGGDGMFLLCGVWVVCGPVGAEQLEKSPGRRICRKCRDRLKQCTLKAPQSL